MFRKVIAMLTLSAFLMHISLYDLAAQKKSQLKPPTFEEIYKNYSFLETTTLAEMVQYDLKEIEKEQKRFDEKEKAEKLALESEHASDKAKLKEVQNQLKDAANKMTKIESKYRSDEIVIEDNKPRKVPRIDYTQLDKDADYQNLLEQKKKLGCQTKEWELKANEDIFKAKREHIKTFYEVLGTHLDILTNWPAESKLIKADLASGKSSERLFANPENIGLRDLGFGNAGEDVKIWKDPEAQRFLDELRQKQYQNPAIKSYVVGLVQTIAKNSDLKIPMEENNILISAEDDPNAFALPGGIININKGLLLLVDEEAQLAGVIAHELAHVAARHTNRLMKKDRLISYFMQAAQLAIMFIPIGYLGYYLIQYGFSGLGMLISLNFLGVSRAFELEADTLGMQYVWKTGYDPMSFMTFFEKMGRDHGYIRQTSFFRTHPAFAKRITTALRESSFLPPKESYATNSTAFLEMKAHLCVSTEIEQAEDKERQSKQYRPTLTRKEQKEDERIQKDCGIVKPVDNRPSLCSDPALEPYKAKAREIIMREQNQPAEELNKPTLKRPKTKESKTSNQNWDLYWRFRKARIGIR
ncbi:MAG: M48 family metalloprotease [bacterium]|nr:M48 family metalloprotease [bacterium]